MTNHSHQTHDIMEPEQMVDSKKRITIEIKKEEENFQQALKDDREFRVVKTILEKIKSLKRQLGTFFEKRT